MLFCWGEGNRMEDFARVPMHFWTSPDLPFPQWNEKGARFPMIVLVMFWLWKNFSWIPWTPWWNSKIGEVQSFLGKLEDMPFCFSLMELTQTCRHTLLLHRHSDWALRSTSTSWVRAQMSQVHVPFLNTAGPVSHMKLDNSTPFVYLADCECRPMSAMQYWNEFSASCLCNLWVSWLCQGMNSRTQGPSDCSDMKATSPGRVSSSGKSSNWLKHATWRQHGSPSWVSSFRLWHHQRLHASLNLRTCFVIP